jgi:hypothetical protein
MLARELLCVQRRRTSFQTLALAVPAAATKFEDRLERHGGKRVNQEVSFRQAATGPQAVANCERRRSRRVKVAVAARIRPYYQTAELTEEVLPATNLSRDGFYFISRRPAYHANMNLYVACPAGHSQTAADAECARVVRVDTLGEAWGVAVMFQRSASLYHGSGFVSQK